MRAGRGTECKKSCAFNYFGGTSPRVPTPAFTRKHAPKLKVESITRVFSNGTMGVLLNPSHHLSHPIIGPFYGSLTNLAAAQSNLTLM